MGKSNSFSTLGEKVAWLLKHPELLKLEIKDELKKHPDRWKIVRAMKRDGLVSKKTYWPDVHLDEAIKQARLRWWETHRAKQMAETR